MRTQFMIMAYNFYNTNTSLGSSPLETSFEEAFDHDFFEWFDEDIPPFSSFSADSNPHHASVTPNGIFVDSGATTSTSLLREEAVSHRNDWSGREVKKDTREKVAFRTKSEVEVLDDGFKWRKYGKKMVKNSRNPRNYYKCSVEGCPVKKRIERDNEDRRYVVTTYEGIHNHEGPRM